MKFTVIAVGKLKERFWVDACAEYLKRLGPYAKTKVVELADCAAERAGGVEAALEREAEAILAAIPVRARVVLLDIEGTQLSSEGLAAHIDELALAGESDLAFVLGGPYGVADSVKERADEALSFGAITLPHNLARVVLLEQLYRACRISRGEPYHK